MVKFFILELIRDMVQKIIFVLIMSICGWSAAAQTPDFFLQRPDVSQAAKDLYTEGLNSGNTDKAYSVMDSVFTDNEATRPFYILLVSRMLPKADGDMMLELNIICRYLAEIYPSSVVSVLFGIEYQTGDAEQEQWAHRMAVEIRITCGGDLMDCFKQSRYTALEHCAAEDKQRLEVLYNMVRRDMNLFQ